MQLIYLKSMTNFIINNKKLKCKDLEIDIQNLLNKIDELQKKL